LGCEAEIALLPLAVFQDAEVFEEFADVDGFGTGDGDIVGGPGIGGDFVFAQRALPPAWGFISRRTKSVKPAFVEAPGGRLGRRFRRQRSRQGIFRCASEGGKEAPVAEQMAHLEGIVDERAGDGAIGL